MHERDYQSGYGVQAEGVRLRTQRSERRHWLAAALAVGVCLVAASPASGESEISYGGDAHGLFNFDFEAYAEYAGLSGTAFATLEDVDLGVIMGEKLVGQVNTTVGTFDVVSGTPSVPLALDTSIDPNVGVNLFTFFGTTIVTGVGPVGFPDPAAIGDGAITMLFDRDQSLVAFDLAGTNRGALHMLFYGRDGQLLSEFDVFDVTATTYVFGSSRGNIAAITINNTDPGGLGYDNLRLVPGPPDRESRCLANGPYFSDGREGGYATVYLEGAAVDDPAGILHAYHWMSDCPGAEFWDSGDPVTILYVAPPDPCQMECSVVLMVDDGVEADVCTASVTIDGEAGGGTLECPPDLIVETDGLGNLADLEGWLTSVVSDSPDVTDDFYSMTYGCNNTGSVTVTWRSEGDPSGRCGGPAECSATFAIVDTTPPELSLDATPIVVEDLDCSGDEYGTLPEATATDAGGVEVDVVSDAPELFPVGKTTVTYTATDDCGLSSSATVEVEVLASGGLEVSLVEHVLGPRKNAGGSSPLASVVVSAYDASNARCVARLLAAQPGEVDAVAGCPLVVSGLTDADGMAWLALPPGRYVVVAEVDRDGDGLSDVALGRATSGVRCGYWKRVDLELRVNAEGEVVPSSGK